MERRQALDSGGWFDTAKAQSFQEETNWDGRNHISLATGSQWDHERLYRTAGGAYAVHHWSQWEGSHDTWVRVEPFDAADWLTRNEYEEIPEDLRGYVAASEVV